MYGRWNLARNNLKRFYQHRFYSEALLHASQPQITSKEDSFSLVANELSQIATQLHEKVTEVVEKVSQDPKLASTAADYFISRAQEKKFRPIGPLLMTSAFNMPISESLRAHQQVVIKSTELFHVACSLQDDKIPGFESLKDKTLMSGNILLTDVAREIADLKKPQVYFLFAKLTRDTGFKGAIQAGATPDSSMESYLESMFYKTASFTSTTCKAIAILAGQTPEVSMLAFEYGRYLGLIYQLTDDILNFTANKDVLGRDALSNIRHPLEYEQLALEYAIRIKGIVEAFPYCNDERVLISRTALIDLPFLAIERLK